MVVIIIIPALQTGHYTNYATLLLFIEISFLLGRETPVSPKDRSPSTDSNTCHCSQSFLVVIFAVYMDDSELSFPLCYDAFQCKTISQE